MNLEEQIELLGKQDLDDRSFEMFSKAARFHGHICPGLAIGAAASISFLGSEERSEDEEIVAIVENDACGVDAIQSILGCTFGKGNLIFRDHGKSVYTFHNRKTGKGLRYSTRDLKMDFEDDGALELFEKVREGKATGNEDELFRKLWVERAASTIKKGEYLFDITKDEGPVPEKARIFQSLFCSKCGEKVSSHRIVETRECPLCIPCSNEEEGDGI